MSDDYPLGADCDLDALVCNIAVPLATRQAIATTILKIGDLLKIDAESLTGIVEQAVEYAEDALSDLDTSPRRGDRAADSPGDGGAPNPKEHP